VGVIVEEGSRGNVMGVSCFYIPLVNLGKAVSERAVEW